MNEKPAIGASFGRTFWREVLLIIIGAAVLELAQGLGAGWFAWYPSELNPSIAEGREWWAGRLDIPERILDTAYDPQTNRVYNVYPPLLSIISFVAHAPIPGRAPPYEFPEFLPLILFGLLLPVVGYWAFSRLTRSAAWAMLMTVGWLGGTALIGALRLARNCDVYHLNHILSQVGLLLMTVEILTRRRACMMLVGLGIAAWSRQLTIFFAPAVFAAIWWSGRQGASIGMARKEDAPMILRPAAGDRGPIYARRRDMLSLAIGLFVIAAVPMGLSWAKFGRPWRSGYALLYDGVKPELHERVSKHGLFSAAYAGENAYYMNVAIPDWTRAGRWPKPIASDQGVSIWFTTPVLILTWLGAPVWWRDPLRRTLMLCSLPIVLAHICYHTSGEVAAGYYRFALDYIAVWLAVSAEWLTTGWRRWATPACMAWSVAYFGLLYS